MGEGSGGCRGRGVLGAKEEGSRREICPGTNLPAGHSPTHRVTHNNLAWSSGSMWLSGKNAGSDLTLPRTQQQGLQGHQPYSVTPAQVHQGARNLAYTREDTQ